VIPDGEIALARWLLTYDLVYCLFREMLFNGCLARGIRRTAPIPHCNGQKIARESGLDGEMCWLRGRQLSLALAEPSALDSKIWPNLWWIGVDSYCENGLSPAMQDQRVRCSHMEVQASQGDFGADFPYHAASKKKLLGWEVSACWGGLQRSESAAGGDLLHAV